MSFTRRAVDRIGSTLQRGATSALGIYATYLAYGLWHPTLRRPYDGPEAQAPLAGDGVVAMPEVDKTFVVDIAAPAEAVWPFLVQMGYGRAGWYTWGPFDNGGVASADEIVPELQRLAVGDHIPDGPHADLGLGVWRVISLVAPTTLVLYSRRVPTTGREVPPGDVTDEPTIDCSWSFVIVPHGPTCRLIVRVRARVDGARGGVIAALSKRLFDVGDTVMEWTMLEGIKARAERGATMPPIPG
jgi:hypothetical protein